MALKREKLTAKTQLLIKNGQAPTCSFFPRAVQFSMSRIHDHGDCSKFEVPRLEKAMNNFELRENKIFYMALASYTFLSNIKLNLL